MVKTTAAALSIAGAVGLFCSSSAFSRAYDDISPIEPGIYGNVEFSADTGDLGGIEIEIHSGPNRIVDITVCEGWCEYAYQVTYEELMGTIYFQIGNTGFPPRKFRVSAKGKNVLIEEDQDFAAYKYRLKRQKMRFGLSVAEDSMEEYAEEMKSQAK